MSSASRPLTILHLLAPARFGGLETVVTTLAPAQAETGDTVVVALVLTPEDSAEHPVEAALRRAGVPTETIVVGSREYRTERRRVDELLRRHSVDVLHTHGYRPDVVDAPVARRLGIGTVSTVHGRIGGTLRGRLYEWVQARAFRRFDAVIAVSAKLFGELDNDGVGSERLHLLPNAWRLSAPPIARDIARKTLSIGADGPRIGWIGRLSAEKAPEVMLRAFEKVGASAACLSLIGSGPEESALREMAADSRLDGRVTFHGSIPDAGTLLPAFDVVALTSWTEGTPMVLLEAMAAGVPIVTTAVGGIPEVLSPTEAHLCEAGRPDQIAAAIDDVFADPEGARARADSARRRLETEFAVEPWVGRHREIYQSILNR